jgi:UDP-N-acetylmuramyl pentapeptide phosphotransferase/UDP-N-acetylglucosamine-1-phosphate transferase
LPILPLVDLLILAGTGSLLVGFVLKAVALTTMYNPTLLGLTPTDFALIAGVFMGLALTLVTRTWLKLNEPKLLEARRRLVEEHARERARRIEEANARHQEERESVELPSRSAAASD